MKRRYSPDLAQDGAECDANYIRLSRLLRPADDWVEFGLGDQPGLTRVRIDVEERCRFTTLLAVRLFGSLGEWSMAGLLKVRMYHDVTTSEVVGWDGVPRFEARYVYPNPRMHMPDEKSQLNRYLGELLSHCLAEGRATGQIFAAILAPSSENG